MRTGPQREVCSPPVCRRRDFAGTPPAVAWPPHVLGNHIAPRDERDQDGCDEAIPHRLPGSRIESDSPTRAEARRRSARCSSRQTRRAGPAASAADSESRTRRAPRPLRACCDDTIHQRPLRRVVDHQRPDGRREAGRDEQVTRAESVQAEQRYVGHVVKPLLERRPSDV